MQIADLEQIKIFTIGHGNRKIEELITLLKNYEIELLIDIRSIPYSRYHPQFRQAKLEASLAAAGIKYFWLGNELGGKPADPTLYHNGKVNYEAVKKAELFKEGLQKVLRLSEQGIKVTLTCSESDQNQCHRKDLIADELVKVGVSVIHINKIGNLERHQNMVNQNLFT